MQAVGPVYITAVQIGFERQRKKQLSKIASVKPYGSMPVCVPPEFGVLGSPQPMNTNVLGVRYGGGGEGECGGGDGDGGGGDGVGNEGSEAGVNVDIAVFPPTLAVGMPAGRPAPFQPMSAKAARLGDEGWVLLAASDARAAPFPPEIVQ